MYSVTADVPSDFNLFASTRDLRAYLNAHHGIPEDAVAQVFFWKNRIDFSLKHDFSDAEWFRKLDG
jgi:hypothetical protein